MLQCNVAPIQRTAVCWRGAPSTTSGAWKSPARCLARREQISVSPNACLTGSDAAGQLTICNPSHSVQSESGRNQQRFDHGRVQNDHYCRHKGRLVFLFFLRGVLVTHAHASWLTYDGNVCGVLTNHWLWEQHVCLCYNCCHFFTSTLFYETYLWTHFLFCFQVVTMWILWENRALSSVLCTAGKIWTWWKGKPTSSWEGPNKFTKMTHSSRTFLFFYLFGSVGSLTIVVPILQLSFLFYSTTVIMLINMNIQVLFLKYWSTLRLKELVSSGISTESESKPGWSTGPLTASAFPTNTDPPAWA